MHLQHAHIEYDTRYIEHIKSSASISYTHLINYVEYNILYEHNILYEYK